MTNVNIDDEYYHEIEKIIKNKSLKLDYPNIRSFVNKAIRDKLRLMEAEEYK